MIHHVPYANFDSFADLIHYLHFKYGFVDPSCAGHGKGLILTFDDGFQSQFDFNLKYLKPYGIKALYFIPTSFIKCDKLYLNKYLINNFKLNANNSCLNEMLPMTWDQIITLSEQGNTIGHHTENHVNLGSCICADRLHGEIIDSAKITESIINKKIDHFAFPFGSISNINKTSAKIIFNNYKYIYTGIRGINYHNQNIFYRDALTTLETKKEVNFILNGGYDIFYLFQRLRIKYLFS